MAKIFNIFNLVPAADFGMNEPIREKILRDNAAALLQQTADSNQTVLQDSSVQADLLKSLLTTGSSEPGLPKP